MSYPKEEKINKFTEQARSCFISGLQERIYLDESGLERRNKLLKHQFIRGGKRICSLIDAGEIREAGNPIVCPHQSLTPETINETLFNLRTTREFFLCTFGKATLRYIVKLTTREEQKKSRSLKLTHLREMAKLIPRGGYESNLPFGLALVRDYKGEDVIITDGVQDAQIDEAIKVFKRIERVRCYWSYERIR